ncbi:YbdD/YjiX family protein [Paucibacter sp. KCTC 42545]|uniref:YbdD/YjiX family protein n=1 Tax=Paucibacter sp. KCTC 42545 TaxID=1768242 RepID=UPI0026906BA3
MAKKLVQLGADLGAEIGQAGRGLAQSLRLMVGLPDYGGYLKHMQATHPDGPVMSFEEFFRERQQARYGGGRGKMCC